jgi:hypothetical protein
MGAMSPAVAAAAGPPPSSFGRPETGAPESSVGQNMTFARFQQRAQSLILSIYYAMHMK